ncbi:hypothetical protein AN963_09505 [Brevibacillus choshinensis]|uniref:Uncharacterized protein n=1 Tax=Brevibacillus choshinensis TaxID=54911 RepID=A0ABR5NEE2_BRECH|nr:hypothetical protein [Brevibacillus choshinensis]KQL49903.1 hypothetical protein AN963_09505 [Brevibacillus choshinensis]
MKWGVIVTMTVLAVLLILYEWPRVKKLPKKDKVVFLTLVFMAWVLSMFDLPNVPGPTTLVQALFKPFGIVLE